MAASRVRTQCTLFLSQSWVTNDGDQGQDRWLGAETIFLTSLCIQTTSGGQLGSVVALVVTWEEDHNELNLKA